MADENENNSNSGGALDQPLGNTLESSLDKNGATLERDNAAGEPGVDADGQPEETPETDVSETDGAGDEKPKADEAGSKLTPRHRATASRLKMSDEDVSKLVDALGESKVVEMLETQAAGLDSISSEYARLGREHREKGAAKPQNLSGDEIDSEHYLLSDGSAFFDPDVVSLFDDGERKGIFEPIRNAFTGLEKRISETVALYESEIANGFFDGLAEQYGDLYGTGILTDPDSDHPQQKARKQLLETAGDIRAGAKLNGRTLPLREAMRRALSQHTGDHAKQAARKEVKKAVETRSRQVGPKPSQRMSRKQDRGRDAAVAEAAKKMKQYGMTSD
jgi:hypothetical protein